MASVKGNPCLDDTEDDRKSNYKKVSGNSGK